jgi:hypothetical protein
MRDFLEIFADVLRIATFQYRPGGHPFDTPRSRERIPEKTLPPSRNGLRPFS